MANMDKNQIIKQETEITRLDAISGHGDQKPDKKNRKKIILIVTTVVVVVALLVSGMLGVKSLRDSKTQACIQANSAYSKAWAQYGKIKKLADETAKTVTAVEQVANAKTYTTFAAEYGKAKKIRKAQSLNCAITYTQVFNASTSSLDKVTVQLNKTTKALKNSAVNVIKSKNVKDLENTKNAVKAKLDEMNNLLNSSNGNVADNATRDNLQNQINAVTAALNDKKATVESLNKVLEPVQGAIDGVNASVAAKQQADAAAAAAAAAQAAPQARSQSAARTSSGAPRSSTRGGSSYSAPAQNKNSGAVDWDKYLADGKAYNESHRTPNQCRYIYRCGTGWNTDGTPDGDGDVTNSK
ncbi:hypothetical protein ACFQY8_01655 [Alloscardovia venturai]|uniref:Colicin transporter n=1 Tax=Alloscardovia venturai TaxID=1769421 RepID=A0ABW2Y2G2_9BIFI